MGLVVSISPCFAQGDREASQELQCLGTAPPEIMCDSHDPKICFDRRRREQTTEGILHNMYPSPKALTGYRLDKFIDPPKAFDQPKDWNTAIPAPFDPPKISNPVLGLIDSPKDWFTYFRRVLWPPGTVQSGK
jgi:hypothetical protein